MLDVLIEVLEVPELCVTEVRLDVTQELLSGDAILDMLLPDVFFQALLHIGFALLENLHDVVAGAG